MEVIHVSADLVKMFLLHLEESLDATGSGKIADYHWPENPTYEELEMREPPRRAALWRAVNTGQAAVVLLAGGWNGSS
jgi:hypothetical protein